MTEIEKMEYAKSFLDKLANGINPLDGTPIPEQDIANHVRISRCFFYVSDVLGQVISNERRREAKASKPKKRYFHITAEQLEHFPYSEEPITLSEFCRRLETLVDLKSMRRLSRASLPLWLVQIGLLCAPKSGEHHYAGEPTEEGLKIGITQVTYTDSYGTHTKNALGIEAQRFVIDHMCAFLTYRERANMKVG